MDRVTTCSGCPYARSGACGSRGSINAEFVVVGEAPGAQEMAVGRPFIGASGQLLDANLAKAGLPRETPVFITNALRCRPPVGTPPSPESIRSCQARLHEELATVPRKVILALGNTSNRSITKDATFKITQKRGQAYDSPYGLVVPAIHPASILRNPGQGRLLTEDVRYAVSLLLDSSSRRSPGTTLWTVVEGSEHVDEAVQRLLVYAQHHRERSGHPVQYAADIETTGLGSPRTETILSIAIAWQKNTVLVFTGDSIRQLAPLFASEYIAWTWHNGKYDTEHLYHLLGIECPVDEDTMLIHYALNELRGTHGLKELAAEWLGAEDYEQSVKRYLRKKSDSFLKVPKGALYRYNAWDTDYTFQLRDSLLEELHKSPGLVKLYYNLLLPASSFLQHVERHGIFVNQERLREYGAELILEQERVQEEFNQLVGFHINLNSWQQLSAVFYQKWKWPMVNRKKPLSTNEETVNLLREYFLSREGDVPRALELLLQWRGASKVKGSYVDNIWEFLEQDSRIHPTYLIHGTHTGRLSCRNPAMQTIPREGPVKSVFQAPPGRMLVELDYSQAELRVLAHLSGDVALRAIFESGRSLHREVAVSIYGERYTPYEYIRTKALNFGIPYGRKAPSIAAEFKIPLHEADDMIRLGWVEQFPQAWAFLEKQAELARRGLVLISPFGRHRHLGLAMSEDKVEELINEAKNFKMQSGASDLTLMSGIAMEEGLKFWEAFVVNIVHDSLLIETWPQHVKEVTNYAASIMRSIPRLTIKATVPFDVEAKFGQAWGYSMKEIELEANPASSGVIVTA